MEESVEYPLHSDQQHSVVLEKAEIVKTVGFPFVHEEHRHTIKKDDTQMRRSVRSLSWVGPTRVGSLSTCSSGSFGAQKI